MLTINLVMSEAYDDEKERFITKTFSLDLEHSLVSLSKWESEFEKPFLSQGEKTSEEVLAYIKAMILTPDFPPEVFQKLTQQNVDQIQNYIEAKRSATTIYEVDLKRADNKIVTSEQIYYWMTAYQIPWEAQYWHLSRLFTLIRILNIENEKASGKKRLESRQEFAARRLALNEQRKAQMGSRG